MVINVVSKKKITFKMLNDAWFAVAQVFFYFQGVTKGHRHSGD